MKKDINFARIYDSIFLKKVKSKTEVTGDEFCEGYFIDSSEKEARKIIESLKGRNKIIAFLGGDNDLNRRALETLKINYLVSPERGYKKDNLKQRDSGLNHILAKEAVRKNIAIVIDFSEIRKLTGKERALRIEKLIQNIIICRKAKCSIKIASFAKDESAFVGERERIAFGISLGMSSSQAKEAVMF